MNKKVLITGMSGQDGSYLAELLLSKGYDVSGTVRRASSFNTGRIDYLFNQVKRYYSDLTDSSSLNRLIEKIQPDEIYNLGAQSHVKISFDVPEYTAETNAVGTLRLLDAIRETGVKTRFYQASTSEMFGGLPGTAPQNEQTPFHPRSPYGAAKLYAHWITVNYRESYKLFACSGILFNHESPRRGENFVTRKITIGVSKIKHGLQEKLHLGNLDAKRDWGYAPDYVEAMWLMLQAEKANDYVIATNETHTVREFCERSFAAAGIDIYWKNRGVEEKAYDRKTNKVLVEIDPAYFRPAEVEYLLGDSSKARQSLGWAPKVRFEELVGIMLETDMKMIKDASGGKKQF